MTSLKPPTRPRWLVALVIFLGLLAMTRMLTYYAYQWHRQLSYSEFYHLLKENPTTHRINEAKLVDSRIEGRFQDGTNFYVYVPPVDDEVMKLLRNNVPSFIIQPPQTGFLAIVMALVPWIILLSIMWFVMRSAQGGGRLLAFGKSRARLVA